jgi:hypothetical protein
MSANQLDNNLQELAYNRLSNYLHTHETQVVAIEVLPPAIHPPDGLLLIDGLSLGVPKKVLVLAYIEARKHFFQNAHKENSQSLALIATKVMLLFDPEHLTAANYRKKHITKLKITASPEAQLGYHKAVQQEFCFLNSILTSPLHRQSKSPTLWHHRLWLLHVISPADSKIPPVAEKREFWRTELDAICKSGQQHPKNYYAWQYARHLLENISNHEASFDFAAHVKDWCCKHPSDISGWSFLEHCLTRIGPSHKRQGLLRDVLNFAINLRCENESLWVFLSSMLAHSSSPRHHRIELILLIDNFLIQIEQMDSAPTLRQ